MDDYLELIQIRTYKHLEIYENEWNTILEKNNNSNPFIEYAFVYNWWRILGLEQQIEIYAVKEHNRIIAFFPFQFEKKWFGYMVHFLALGDANYMDFIVRKVDKSRAIMYLFDELIKLKKSAVFNLHGLLESTDTPNILSDYLKVRNMKQRYNRIETPYVNLQNMDFEDYMKPRRKMHGMDRREKRLRALGDVSLQIASASVMDKIVKMHKKRWEKKNDTSGFSSKRKQVFFRYLAEQKPDKMGVRLSTLLVGDEIIAFTYGFTCRGRYMGYVLGHNSDFDCYGPGRLLIKEKIQRCLVDNFQKLDMSIGYEPYKFDWNTNLDYTRKTIFSTNTIRAKAFRNFLWVKEMLIAKIKKYRFFVLFRRNTIGKLKYLIRNKWEVQVWKSLWKEKIVPFFYEKKEYVIVKLSDSELKKVSNFKEITTQMVLTCTNNRNEMLQKLYNGYVGHYTSTIQDAFWVNKNVIRLEDIELVTNLIKRSVYIRDWKKENLEEIISFVQTQYSAKYIYMHVNRKDLASVVALEHAGFLWEEKLTYSRKLGRTKLEKVVAN